LEDGAMSMGRGEAQSLRIKEALGAHIIADSYRDTVPDDEQDASYLRKQETFWRLTARAWLCDVDTTLCHDKAKTRMADSPEFKKQLDAIRAKMAKTL
jgi:hypothetical protein